MKQRVSSFLMVSLFALLLAAVGFRSYATANGVPLLGVDARVFLPQTVPFYERGELINEVWRGGIAMDPSGQGRMVYHGFLYPILVSKLMWRGDYLALAGSLAFLHALATLLGGVLLLAFAKRWRWELSHRRLLLILFLTVAGANYTQGSLGRPDPLAAIILMSATLLASATSFRWHKVIAGVVIGLLAAVAPVVAILGGLFFAGYAAWRRPARHCVIEVVAAAALSVAIFGCCFLWYPYSFSDWWSGTLRMSRSALDQGMDASLWRRFLYDYVARGSSWFLAATIPLVLWSGWRIRQRSYRGGGGPAAPVLFYGALLLTSVAIFRFVLYVSWARYNLLPLMPLGFLAIFHELGRTQETNRRSIYRPAALTILAAASLGFAGDLFERAHLLRTGLTLPKARARFATLRTAYPGAVIGLHQNLFTLTEDRIAFGRGNTPPSEATLWLQSQAYSQLLQPPEVSGFRLVENHFNSQTASVFGRPLWTGDRSCGFAVYLRDRGD